MSLKKLLGFAILSLGITQAQAAVVPYAGQGSPVIGASVITTGGNVIATFVSGSGSYDNYLYLDNAGSPFQNAGGIGANWIFENHLSSAGQTVNLGNFAPGTVLLFNVLSDTHGGGSLNWYTGPSALNADGFAHAFVDSSYTGPFGGAMVGFEDLAGLGDAGYEDIRYTFTNVQAGSAIPEPATLAIMGLGILALCAGFKRKA